MRLVIKILLVFLVFASTSNGAATRYYLPISGASAVNPGFDTWIDTTTASPDGIKPVTTKSNTALTDKTGTAIAASTDALFRQYVSDPIGVINFNGTTFSAVIRCVSNSTSNAALRLSVRLYHSDTTFTTLLTLADFGTALGTSASTRIVSAAALANVTSTNNDRIVVEFGGDNTHASATRNITLRFGDNAASDFALTSGLTTDLNPWIEFSATIPAPAVAASGHVLPLSGAGK